MICEKCGKAYSSINETCPYCGDGKKESNVQPSGYHLSIISNKKTVVNYVDNANKLVTLFQVLSVLAVFGLFGSFGVSIYLFTKEFIVIGVIVMFGGEILSALAIWISIIFKGFFGDYVGFVKSQTDEEKK